MKLLTEMTDEERASWYKERASRGATALNASRTAEERSKAASNAVMVRWAMRQEIGLYPRKGDALKRIDYHLKTLNYFLGKALMEKDYREARACVSAMYPWERAKMWLVEGPGSKQVGAVLEVSTETEARLEEARKRRQQAMEPEVVEPEPKKT